MATDVRVTVVVLTYNRMAEVVRTVTRLSHLPERPAIIVVDNGSADGTATVLARDFPEISVVRLAKNIGAAARNVGIQRARTPYVALCDDDTWWQPGSLSRAGDFLAGYPRLAIVNARVLVGPEGREDPTCEVMAASPLTYSGELPGPSLLGFLAGASVIRRSAVLGVGGFEPRFFIGGEESLVALDLAAAGWAITYIESITVCHYPSSHRNVPARQRLLYRNALWLAWLRRPPGSAARQTARLLRSAVQRPQLLPAFTQALVGLPWVLRNRRVVPAAIEAKLRRLEIYEQS